MTGSAVAAAEGSTRTLSVTMLTRAVVVLLVPDQVQQRLQTLQRGLHPFNVF